MENCVALFLPKVSREKEREREREGKRDSSFELKNSLETEVVSFKETRIRSRVKESEYFPKIIAREFQSNDPQIRSLKERIVGEN